MVALVKLEEEQGNLGYQSKNPEAEKRRGHENGNKKKVLPASITRSVAMKCVRS